MSEVRQYWVSEFLLHASQFSSHAVAVILATDHDRAVKAAEARGLRKAKEHAINYDTLVTAQLAAWYEAEATRVEEGGG